MKIALYPIAGLLMLAACSTFTEQDRATLNSANAAANQAKTDAAAAAANAQRAEQRAAAAEEASKKAAADAQAARNEANQMFQKSIKK